MYASFPLDPAKRQCRVVSLQPGRGRDQLCGTLSVVNLDTAVFDCLSYVWGNEAEDRVPMRVGDNETLIQPNLADFLHHIRKPDRSFVLWIDAVCIDQDNLDEKAYQIGLMGNIYELCQVVYIWLGAPTGPPSAKLNNFALIQHFAGDKHVYELPGFSQNQLGHWEFDGSGKFQDLWEAFLPVMNSPWWTRSWTVQEAILPSRCIVKYGNYETTFETFVNGRRNRNRHRDEGCNAARAVFAGTYSKLFDHFLETVHWLEDTRECYHNFHKHDAECLPFHEIVHRFSYRACKEPRDKVNSIIAVAKDPAFATYEPDYKTTVGDCYEDVFKRMLQETGGDYRCFMGRAYGPERSGFESLPSWVRNFAETVPLNEVGPDIRRRIMCGQYRAAGATPARFTFPRPRALGVTGLPAATIVEVGPAIGYRQLVDGSFNVPLGTWIELARKHFVLEDGDGARRRLSRVLCGSCVTISEQEELAKSDTWWRRTTDKDMPSESEWKELVGGNIFNLHRDYEGGLVAAVSGRCLFVTDTNNLGLCNPNTHVGDQVWVLFGSDVPFILREAQQHEGSGMESRYHLVSDCFLEGAMDGEGLVGGAEGRSLVLV